MKKIRLTDLVYPIDNISAQRFSVALEQAKDGTLAYHVRLIEDAPSHVKGDSLKALKSQFGRLFGVPATITIHNEEVEETFADRKTEANTHIVEEIYYNEQEVV